MSISSIVEKWDTIAYLGYNLLAKIQFAARYPKYRNYLNRNKELLKKHDGERCFIVLNGHSLNRYDLTKISNEHVFCTNYIFDSHVVDIVRPDYYCITDNGFFSNPDSKDNLERLFEKCSYSNFIFNIKYAELHKIKHDRQIYLTYNRHMPNMLSLKSNLCGLTSGFISVSLYAINVAIYLGFKEIYLLGYDFEPGIFSHFYQDADTEKDSKNRQKNDINKDGVCGRYWQYSQAQYQNYYIQKYAISKGVSIHNCNEQSHVRSFPFVEYETIFGEDEVD